MIHFTPSTYIIYIYTPRCSFIPHVCEGTEWRTSVGEYSAVPASSSSGWGGHRFCYTLVSPGAVASWPKKTCNLIAHSSLDPPVILYRNDTSIVYIPVIIGVIISHGFLMSQLWNGQSVLHVLTCTIDFPCSIPSPTACPHIKQSITT